MKTPSARMKDAKTRAHRRVKLKKAKQSIGQFATNATARYLEADQPVPKKPEFAQLTVATITRNIVALKKTADRYFGKLAANVVAGNKLIKEI